MGMDSGWYWVKEETDSPMTVGYFDADTMEWHLCGPKCCHGSFDVAVIGPRIQGQQATASAFAPVPPAVEDIL